MATLSIAEHKRILYREMLESLRRVNEAEAEFLELYELERQDGLPSMLAELRAEQRAVDRGIIATRNNHRERVIMNALLWLVSNEYEKREGSSRGGI